MENEKFKPNEQEIKKTEVNNSKPKIEINAYENTSAKNASNELFKKQSEYYNESEKDNAVDAESKFNEYSSLLNKLFTLKTEQENAKKNPEKYAEALGYIADLMKANDPVLRKADSSW